MRWIVRLLVLYAVVVLVGVVTVAASSATVAGRSVHPRMNVVSHQNYELHRSIAHVP